MRHFHRIAVIWLLWLGTAAASTPNPTALDQSHSEQRKPGSAIKLTGTNRFDLHNGQSLAAELGLDATGVTGDLHISLKMDNGLQLLSNQTEWNFSAPVAAVITLPIEIVATAQGRHLVHIFATEKRVGHNLARAMAVVVDVAGSDSASKHKSHSQVKTLPSKTTFK